MESALRVVKLVRRALLAGIVLYALVGELAARVPASPPSVMLFNALTLLSIVMLAAIVVVRRFLVVRSQEALSSRPEDTVALNRWRAGYLATYVLCEGVALYGLMLRFLGFTLTQVAPFYLAGSVLMLFFSPRLPSRALS